MRKVPARSVQDVVKRARDKLIRDNYISMGKLVKNAGIKAE